LLRKIVLSLILLLLAVAGTSCLDSNEKEDAEQSAAPVDLQLLALTDFHGYLRPMFDDANGRIKTPEGNVQVGGAAYIAAHIKKLREGHPNSIVLSVGDNFSGWPFEVDAFKNEPTIEFLNRLGVAASVAGNHEFDISGEFLTEHMMKGKCFGTVGVDSCFKDSSGNVFQGAKFEYLSANVRDAQTGKLLLKPYVIKTISDGKGGTIPVGIIGITEAGALTKEQMSVQPGLLETDGAPAARADLPADPAARALVEPANRYAKELQDMGVETIIVLLHEGGSHSGPFNGCFNPKGPAIDFAKYASPAIDVILAGHWHTALNCSIPDPAGNPRPVMEGSYHGKLINEVQLKIDPLTKDVLRDQTVAVNRLVTREIEPDPEMAQMIAYWIERGKEKWAEPLTKFSGSLTRARNAHGESTLTNVIADAFYEAGKASADLALVAVEPKKDLYASKGDNPADQDGLLLFGELYEAVGTHHSAVTVTFTGDQIKQILEEQWKRKPDGTESFHPLSVSSQVRYKYDRTKEIGHRIDPAHVMINGRPLDLKKSYRVVTTGSLLVSGADLYPTFAGYADARRIASWPVVDYFKNQDTVMVPELNRVLPVKE
jgi:5'-nucleotidase